MQNAGRNQMQDKSFIPDYYSVSGVVTALIPGYDIESRSENIDNFTFSFVAPLCANNDQVFHTRAVSLISISFKQAKRRSHIKMTCAVLEKAVQRKLLLPDRINYRWRFQVTIDNLCNCLF